MKTCLGFLSGFVFLVALVGCGGGGGGTGGGPLTLVNWSSITPPETIRVNGISKDSTYSANIEAPPAYVFVERPLRDASYVTLTFATDGSLEKIVATTPDLVKTWDTTTSVPDTITDSSEWIYAVNDIQSDVAIISNPMHADSNPANPGVGWEYQTFGAWETGRGFDSGTVGGISIGATTPSNSIPTTDVVMFEGNTSGVFVDATGIDYFTTSTLDAEVDFSNTTVDISSSNSHRISINNLLNESPVTMTPDSHLDWDGFIDYAPGTDTVTVKIGSSVGSIYGMSGTTTFQFYGPNADELGGVFSLSVPPTPSQDLSTLNYYGAYGAAPRELP